MIFLLFNLLTQTVFASGINVECFVTWVSPKSDLDEALTVWGHGDDDYSKISFSQNSKRKIEVKIGGFHYANKKGSLDVLTLEDADDFIYATVEVDAAALGKATETFQLTYAVADHMLRLDHKPRNSKKFYKLASARCH